MLKHGGNLREAAKQYGIALNGWLDLSTGINPQHYKIPDLHPAEWQRLPEEDDGLTQAACAYYGCQAVLPTAGSQAAIQVLPQMRKKCRVAMPRNMYQEHAHAWQQQGHRVLLLDAPPTDAIVDQCDVLLVCHPNNPTGQHYPKQQLLQWHRTLSAKKGWLIIDEAFMDMTPEHSLATMSHLSGLIILRSIGKFFGLAGARVGFLLAEPAFLRQVQERLGPWSIAGPSRVVAQAALKDKQWQTANRDMLILQSQRLRVLLTQYGLKPSGGTALFQYVEERRAMEIRHALAKQGVWVRLFEECLALRFGLPPDNGWQRLEAALSKCVNDLHIKS